jgi:predicted nuclease of predicted toxin-antitoxin system
MKFLIDANLPYKLASLLKAMGQLTVHTDDLPNQERTTDYEIRTFAREGNYIVVTKDSDFLDSHLISNDAAQLLYIATGNISNKQLLLLLERHFIVLMAYFERYNLIELNNSGQIIHENG